MNAVLILAVILGMTAQNVSKKAYNQKVGEKGTYLFNAMSTLAAALFFVISSGGSLSFRAELLPWSLAFAAAYGSAIVGSLLAISCGSLALTSLVISYSLVLPTLFGILFLNEPISVCFFAGLALLLISLLLINTKKGESKLSLRWVVYALIAFLGNGACTIVQKLQQNRFDGEYKSEFMITALAIVCLAMLVASLGSERKQLTFYLRNGSIPAVCCGVSNGMVNLLVMILTGRMAVSVMFPLISAGGILATAAVSLLFYKEKLTAAQKLSVLLGVGAIVFLSL